MAKEETTEVKDVQMIPIYIMGKHYEVPEELTIMKAVEYAGYRYVRGCGCRGGICGACATVYRIKGDYKIYTGLACQTVVQPEMYLAQLPFFPAGRAEYDLAKVDPTPETITQLYPELFRCVACNACTKVCPMDVQVMDYVAELKRGDIAKAAVTSFDCIQCGLCTARCFGELPQYHIAQLARRLAGSKISPRAEHMAKIVADIEAGAFDEELSKLKTMDDDALKEVYSNRQMEPAMSPEDWTPDDKTGLVE
jgi:succinate dehydrogenase/fumarate reductase-like Fe-S protein